MYVDESGDDVMDQSKWSSPDARYLGLTGVVIASEDYRTRIHPQFEALKQEFFPYDPDEPLVLVRQKIVQKKDTFGILQDQDIATHWDERILQFLDDHVSQVIFVVLDKQAYLQSALLSSQNPYGYCISALAERYGQWLNSVGGTGDVMAEARGKKEDQELQKDFHRFMTGDGIPQGTQESRRQISSSQIKVNLKSRNITGLQLADLLAYPSMRGVLQENGRSLDNPPSQATRRFFEVIQSKSQQSGVLLS